MGGSGLELEDADLLARVARGDERAFMALYDRYSGLVYALVRGILRDAHMAEDVTQDVFISLWKGATRFDPTRGKARSWILSVAHHKAVDAVRRRRAEQNATPGKDFVGEDVAQEVLRHLEAGCVGEALRALSPSHREALLLAYFRGHTQREIAERLGVPLGTVKTRIRDGMIRLRTLLRDCPEGVR